MKRHRARPLAATVGIVTMLCACSRESCVNQAVIGLPSPDGARIAYVFHRTCGAAVTTHVSVISLPNALRNESGNVLAVSGEQPVKIAWRSPTTLRVTGFSDATFKVDHPTRTGERRFSLSCKPRPLATEKPRFPTRP